MALRIAGHRSGGAALRRVSGAGLDAARAGSNVGCPSPGQRLHEARVRTPIVDHRGAHHDLWLDFVSSLTCECC